MHEQIQRREYMTSEQKIVSDIMIKSNVFTKQHTLQTCYHKVSNFRNTHQHMITQYVHSVSLSSQNNVHVVEIKSQKFLNSFFIPFHQNL